MRKIGFVSCSAGWGGLEMNVLKLAGWLSRRDWDITLYLNENSRIYKESNTLPIKTRIIPTHRKYFDVPSALRFSRILKKENIHDIFVFDNRDLDFIYLTKKFLFSKLKVIYQQHMQIGVSKKDLLHTLRFSGIDYWIAPLNFLKKEVEEKTSIESEKIKVIPLGLETDKFIHPKYSKQEARNLLNIDTSVFLMGIMGRIDPKKGQLFLVEAIHELKKKNINIELLIIGEPTLNDEKSLKYLNEIKEFVTSQGIEDRIHLRKFTSDVSVFYNAIDLFALASEGETYGMVTIEAMLSKLPIIATNSSGTPEILGNGEFGYLYKQNDLSDFYNKILLIIENYKDSENKASKAQQNAIEEYSYERECRLIEELLSK